MEDIQHKIELLFFNHIVSIDGIIEDEGEHNVPLEYDNNIRYTFTDTNEYGTRSLSEQKKLKFINDAMEIMSDVHLFIYQNDPMNKPIYFVPDKITEEKQILNDAPPDHESDFESDESDIECEDIEILNDTMDGMSI